ncbi:MAG: acetoin utilization protein AcuC [Chloroflexi bacterium]|nr:acetoin utilization protein AcuC [Chloroflexota bacterium]
MPADDVLSRHVLREDHVMVPTRLRYTCELLKAYDAFSIQGSQLAAPRMAAEEEVLSFHTKDYVAAVRALSQGYSTYNPSNYGFSEAGDNPVFPGMWEASLWSTGASIVAAELVGSGAAQAACNLSGGLHHAMPGHASGFCIFNDPAIAILHLLRKGLRVAYVDIDAHHGDGVQHAFYDTDQVLTISLHESGEFLFPGTGFVHETGSGKGKGYSVNIPFYPFTTDEVYLWAFQEIVPPLIRAFNPDVLVTQLGMDTHFNDPITHMKLTVQGHNQVVRELGGLCPRWVALGGGGHDIPAVIRGWTLDYGTMLGLEWPDEVPASYQEQYGLKLLRDPEPPDVEPGVHQETWRYARERVAELKALVFPLHGLPTQ